MVAKDRQKNTDSTKVEVGEIDTRAPFQSVKDAVSLFGEGAFSGEKPAIKKIRPHSAERVLAKETQLLLAQKDLNKLKEQLKNAENTKAQALVELVNAKRAVDDLTHKLKTIGDSKELAVKAAEAAKTRTKQLEEVDNGKPEGPDGSLKQELEAEREKYISGVAELDAAKQDLRKIRKDFDASLDTKVSSLKQATEAEHGVIANTEKAKEISKEISSVRETIGHVKLASDQAHQEQAKIYAEKDVQRQQHKANLEESMKKLFDLRREFDPEIARNLKAKLAETESEIVILQKEMESAKIQDLDSVKTVTTELDDAKESLQKVAEEGSSLRELLESRKAELKKVKKEHFELNEKEAEAESIAANLNVELQKLKAELEAFMGEKSKTESSCDEMVSALHQLALETENARREAEDMKKKVEELKGEAETSRIELEEAEKKLKVALEEAEEAKAREAKAVNQIKVLSEITNAARSSTSSSGANITISRDEVDALSRKVEESDILAEMKAEAAMAQVEAVKASENEALKKFEATQKEIDEMKALTVDAIKKAEMAEAAKKAVEGELRRWREREQKKAAEAASRILAETEMSSEVAASPRNYKIQKQNTPPPEKTLMTRKLEKQNTGSVPKKTLLSNMSGIFQRKKVGGG